MPKAARPIFRRHLPPAGLAILLLACNRYEYRTMLCPNPRPSLSAIAWEYEAGHPRSIHLRVTGVEAGLTLISYVAILLPDSVWQRRQNGGDIQFDSVAPGAHHLEVRGLGFRSASVVVWVPAQDSGVEAVASLAVANDAISELCSSRQLTRKPWWKFW
jgi:hypothetical protein